MIIREELKTLKDFRGDFEKGCIDWWKLKSDGDFVNYHELRQEAIKWYKFYETIPGCMECGSEDVGRFIKQFFNLTEEEIKESE